MTDKRALAFQARLAERGIAIEPREMDDSTHTLSRRPTRSAAASPRS